MGAGQGKTPQWAKDQSPRWAKAMAALSETDAVGLSDVLMAAATETAKPCSKEFMPVSLDVLKGKLAETADALWWIVVILTNHRRSSGAPHGGRHGGAAAGGEATEANGFDLVEVFAMLLSGSDPVNGAKASTVILEAHGGAARAQETAKLLVHKLAPAVSAEGCDAILRECGTGADGVWSVQRFFSNSPILSFFDREARTALRLSAPPLHGSSSALPALVDTAGKALESELLSDASRWILAGAMPPSMRGEWVQLFHSHKDGLSFVRLEERITDRGPTLVLIRDTGGAVFGGFAKTPWRRATDFFGEAGAFVFSLAPRLALYGGSGRNQNWQYLNAGTQTQVNGLGFGGKTNFMGIFLPFNLDGGTARECSTYASPVLATEEHFSVSFIEVWSVALPVVEESSDDGGKRSVLKDAETRAFLEIAGVQMHTQMVEPPPADSVPQPAAAAAATAAAAPAAAGSAAGAQ
eukprot:c6872_g1_i1.p1 GENE.c6872_g1_i1~~c6872_g1_i1.p1  ORF type:complete len:467 (+),score=99.05 c6872_g1_i1:32-1432(+)